ncbi:MAG: prephenate dehydrogenase, partial [Chthoniobacteraceae bacterium]
MTRLAILGPGLLGGSLALTARRVGRFHVRLWARRESAADELRRMEIADHISTSLEETCAEADLAIFCMPVGAMPALARDVVQMLPEGALVTDVGSVKAKLVRELSEIFGERCRFVGSHPMAGSEQTGVQAARADLFENAVCIVTPEQRSNPQAVLAVRSFWEQMGCSVRMLSPEEHDEVVALVSHLPHLAAAALVNTVAAQNERATAFSGPGFRDTTRVAGGAPAMWTEIMANNREPLRKSAEAMIEKLREFI